MTPIHAATGRQLRAYPPALLARVRRAKCWRLAAWHEAGHAVAGLLVRRPVVRVELLPVGDHGLVGQCVYARHRGDPDPIEWTARRAERHAVCMLAGGEAERLLVGRNSAHWRYSDDTGIVDVALSRAGGDELRAMEFLRRMEGRTRALIQANRDAVERVAATLLASDRLTLSGGQVRDAVGEMVNR